MAVLEVVDSDDEWLQDESLCFVCVEDVLERPAISWDGGNGRIILHPKCALYLGECLISDAKVAMGKVPPDGFPASVQEGRS